MKRGKAEVKKILTVFFPILMAVQFPMTVTSQEADTWLSEDVQSYCEEIGEEYGICPEFLEAIIETESSGQADAENGGCKGLMQISEKWHRDRMKRLGVTDIYDTYGNILVGTDYLAELFEEYGEASLVLDLYHGDSRAQNNYENGILLEYAAKILERSAELEILHGK